MASPTDGGAEALLHDESFWALVRAPLSFDAGGPAASFAPSVDAAAAYAADAHAGLPVAKALMAEKAFYALATSAVPAHVSVAAKQRSASTLFGPESVCSSRWTFDAACKPELPAHAPAGSSLPVFQGELKSVDGTMLGQALYYVLMNMTSMFFPAVQTDASPAPGRRVFYAAPPLGFALLGFPHVGYFVAVEWVGKVLVSPASLPFFLGSAEHRAAVAALPAAPRGAPEWLFDAALPWTAAPGSPSPPPVAWAVCADGLFRKVVRADVRSAAGWAEMFAAFARLRELWRGGEGAPPAALVCGARLLFGAHEVVVEMPAVAGRAVSDDEATGGTAAAGGEPGPALRAVADAIAWLAARRVLYTDVRGPNVLADGASGAVRVVDYDDCVVADAPVRSAAAFRAELARVEAARAARRGLSVAPPTFAARLALGAFPRFEDALDRAFARQPAA
jgi:hypothetical protein